MSFYSSIDRRINADKWFRERSHLAQLLWFRLLTGPHVTPVAGLWPATDAQLSRAFGMSETQFRKYFEELAGTEQKQTGKVHADWKAGVLWFPRAIHVPANQPRNENSLRGWTKHLELVPECELRDRGLTEIITWVASQTGPDKRFQRGLPNNFPTPSKLTREQLSKLFQQQPQEQDGEHVPRAKQEQEQEQDQEQEQEQPAAANNNRFAMFPEWQPRPDIITSFKIAAIPDWAIPELVARHRSAFVAKKTDIRTQEDWEQSCSKWVYGDWSNPKKRPKKPEQTDEENGGYGDASGFK